MSTVIKVENLSKRYRLGVINRDMLYKDLQSRWAKFRGKEDPNAPIGFKHDKRFEHGDEFWALRNVDLEVKEGEILGIIGRNGAGKSTLLKILSQITAPTEGKVKIKGRIASLLEVGTGFHPELTGRENVYLNGAILGMTRKEVRSKFDEIVAFAEIDEFIDTPVKRYSSGMYVRLAFAVAAHLDPEILIVDEVLAVGDVKFQAKCTGKLDAISKTGRTVLFVSHNLPAVKALCSSAAIFGQGLLIRKGDTANIIEEYRRQFLDIETSFPLHPERADMKKGCITSVRIIKNDPSIKGVRHQNTSFCIKITINLISPINHFIASFGLSTLDDKPFRVVWSKPSNLEPGSYDVLFEENVAQISRGTYKVSVGISEHTNTIHYEEDCGRLCITDADSQILRFNEPGVIINPVATWIRPV